MTYHIETQRLIEQPTAVLRASLPIAEIGTWLLGAYEEVMAYLVAAGAALAGPPFARYTFHDHLVDAEAGFPVSTPVPGNGRVSPSSLPGGPAAVTTHYGPYENLTVAYDAIADWLKEHGHEAGGSHWEVYYTNPQAEPDAARWRTDLIAPYRPG